MKTQVNTSRYTKQLKKQKHSIRRMKLLLDTPEIQENSTLKRAFAEEINNIIDSTVEMGSLYDKQTEIVLN